MSQEPSAGLDGDPKTGGGDKYEAENVDIFRDAGRSSRLASLAPRSRSASSSPSLASS